MLFIFNIVMNGIMKRGRPVKSQIRQNIIEILYYLKKGYGYQIAKLYNEIFSPVTQRSVYYHLRKGLETKEMEVHQIQQEEGDFSWGPSAEWQSRRVKNKSRNIFNDGGNNLCL